jgi:hypothetical protein
VSRLLALPLLLPLFLLVGCEDDLPKATEIVHMRILGAKLQAVNDADETRATPKPGERVRVSLETVFPSIAESHRFMHTALISCTAPDRYTGGIPVCQELIDLAESGQDLRDSPLANMAEFPPCDADAHMDIGGAVSATCTVGENPVAEFPVPEDYKRDRLLFIGIACEKDSALIDPTSPQLFKCASEDDPMYKERDENGKLEHEPPQVVHVHGLIPVQHTASEENHNPDIGPDAFRIERQLNGEWKPVDPALLDADTESDCLNVNSNLSDDDKSQLPLLYGNIDFRLIYNADAREEVDGKPEPLEITLYTTAGELERRFTVFDSDDVPTNAGDEDKPHELSSTLRYTPPVPPPSSSPEAAEWKNGKLVRFFATVRDQRGGFAISQYALCLGP